MNRCFMVSENTVSYREDQVVQKIRLTAGISNSPRTGFCRFDRWFEFIKLVEVAGIEPASENIQHNSPTCVADDLRFAVAHAHRPA